jgi:hypothetical protein
MDDSHFDALSRFVESTRTRRGLARALVGLTAIGGAILARIEPAGASKPQSRKRKKACGPCKRNRRGRCRPKADATPCGECGVCLDGGCTPAKVDCGGPCMECAAGARCQAKPDGAVCLGTGSCLNGLCVKPV